MKILHMITGLGTGGAENMLKKICFLENSIEHQIISFGADTVLSEELSRAGINVTCLNLKQYPYRLFKLFYLIKHSKPDVIQTWLYHADLLGGIFAKIIKTFSFKKDYKIVWNVRQSHIPKRKEKFSRWVTFNICKMLSRIIPDGIVYCGQYAEKTHILNGFHPKKSMVIPNGFESQKFTCEKPSKFTKSSLNLPLDSIIIGSVSRFDSLKDHGTFLEAVLPLVKAKKSVFVVLAGNDVDFKNKFFDTKIPINLRDRFILLGNVNDTSKLYGLFDVFCLHSKSEGFPNVLGEAMCCCCCCVTTDVGDVKILIGDTGFIVPAQSASLLRKELKTVIELPKMERQKKGKNSRLRIIDKFTIEKIFQQYLDFYRDL